MSKPWTNTRSAPRNVLSRNFCVGSTSSAASSERALRFAEVVEHGVLVEHALLERAEDRLHHDALEHAGLGSAPRVDAELELRPVGAGAAEDRVGVLAEARGQAQVRRALALLHHRARVVERAVEQRARLVGVDDHGVVRGEAVDHGARRAGERGRSAHGAEPRGRGRSLHGRAGPTGGGDRPAHFPERAERNCGSQRRG